MINLAQDRYSEEEARQVLEILYQKYFQRNPDPSGQSSYIPPLKEYGFYGLIFVASQIIQSKEMDRRVQTELNELYLEHLGRTLDPTGRQSFDIPIRFLRHIGREAVINRIKNSPEYRKRESEFAHLDELVKTAKERFEKDPKDVEAGLSLASHYDSTRRWGMAAEVYTKIIEYQTQPRSELFLKRGIVYQNTAKWPQAAKDFSRVIEIGVENEDEVFFRRGEAYERMGDIDHALADYKHVATLETSLAPASWHRIGLIQQNENPQEAIESFTKAISLNPINQDLLADIYVARARLYHQVGQQNAAASDFSRFVARSKNRKRLIQDMSPTVYFVHDGQKHGVPDPPTLNYIALEHTIRLLERVSTLELNAYPEGDIIRSVWEYPLIEGPDHAIYWIEDGKRRWIPNPQTFNNFTLDWMKVEKKSKEEIKEIAIGKPVPNILGRAILVRSRSDGTYFLIEEGKRRSVPNETTLHALGYKEEEVEELDSAEIHSYPEGMQIPDLT